MFRVFPNGFSTDGPGQFSRLQFKSGSESGKASDLKERNTIGDELDLLKCDCLEDQKLLLVL
jgi:hypothetical protein